ncbi:MAG: F0F1 ATP synthase subunit delta [Alphaproteobacteria bacterium]|nr:F0F1 ATP synthase subunit delta [Alphaproteobacteria bacterium]
MKNQSSKRIAERYVKALFDVAQLGGALPAVEKDLAALNAAVAASDELQRFIESPLLTREQKASAMQAVLVKQKANDITVKFLLMLARQKRLDALPAIAELFANWAEAARGEMSASVTSASKLSDKDAGLVADRLSKAYGKKINLSIKEDASLLGGVVVHIGSIQLDGSLSGKLRRLKQKLAA